MALCFPLVGWLFQSPGPIILQLGPFALRWYGLLIALAVILGMSLSQFLAEKRRIHPDRIADLAIWLVLGAIPGARLYYVLFQWSDYAGRPGEMVAIWHGGIAIHGAILGGTLAMVLFALRYRLSFWQLADVVMPAVILGQAIGRWGNFFNSEAFGAPTDLPWKLYIPPIQRPLGFVQVDYFHPTFLYESLWNLGVFGLLMWLFFRSLCQPERFASGTLLFVYLIAYGLGRLWIEGLRMDSLMLGPLRIAQVVSLVGMAIGGLGLVWLYYVRRPLPDAIPYPRGIFGAYLSDKEPEA